VFQNFEDKSTKNIPLRRTRGRGEGGNIRIDLKEIGVNTKN
jgi:hypothetical protein